MFQRPWTLITYMFLHGDIWHILFNMVALYFFGNRVEDRLGGSRFLVLYFLSGISGGLLSFLFAPRVEVIGASAAIYGVMLAYARFWPRDVFMFWGVIPVEARWLVAISTLFDLFAVQPGVAHFAHLGGFLGGFLYLIYLDRRHGAKKFRSVIDKGAPQADSLASKWQKVNRDSIHEVNRDEVNRILDKISATGLKSLTPQERLFLSNFVPPDDRKPIPPN
jgi:membrane associated rhomboid family serine protease